MTSNKFFENFAELISDLIKLFESIILFKPKKTKSSHFQRVNLNSVKFSMGKLSP